MPGLPGAACSSSSLGLWAIFHASACSRPPEPTMSTLTGRVYSGGGAQSRAVADRTGKAAEQLGERRKLVLVEPLPEERADLRDV